MVKIKIDRRAVGKIGEQAARAYADAHRGECAYCHKRVQPPDDLPSGAVPVCAECAEAHHLT